jgi:pyruvate formate lyase activating enzyme
MHFTAFHPDFRMLDHAHTPTSTLRRARDIALRNGVHHAYTGNVHDPEGETTRCVSCGTVLVGRNRYTITGWGLDSDGRCAACGQACAGVFAAAAGTWGARRRPVRLAEVT